MRIFAPAPRFVGVPAEEEQSTPEPAPAEAGVQNLLRLRFLEEAGNVVLGKSHLVTGPGLRTRACGHAVRFTSAIDAVNTLRRRQGHRTAQT